MERAQNVNSSLLRIRAFAQLHYEVRDRFKGYTKMRILKELLQELDISPHLPGHREWMAVSIAIHLNISELDGQKSAFPFLAGTLTNKTGILYYTPLR